jgi:hypothetical protein
VEYFLSKKKQDYLLLVVTPFAMVADILVACPGWRSGDLFIIFFVSGGFNHSDEDILRVLLQLTIVQGLIVYHSPVFIYHALSYFLFTGRGATHCGYGNIS